MKKNNLTFIFFCGLLFLFCGCGTGGKAFNYRNVNNLVIGKTTPEEAENLLGTTSIIGDVINKNGHFQLLTYDFAYVSMVGGSAQRRLLLEFKNGILNGKINNSGFQKDNTNFKIDNAKNIKKGETSKSEVLKLMGEPSGRVVCPTSISDFVGKYKDSSEVWTWMYSLLNSNTPTVTIKQKSLIISFDKKGIVKSITTVNQQ